MFVIMEIQKGFTSRMLAMFGFMLLASFMTSAEVQATEWECGERSNLPLEGKNYCAAGDFRLSHANLMELFDELLEKHNLVFGDADALRHAQTSFESYRDHQCAAVNQRIRAKPYYPMVVSQCKTRYTNIRIDELKKMLEQEL